MFILVTFKFNLPRPVLVYIVYSTCQFFRAKIWGYFLKQLFKCYSGYIPIPLEFFKNFILILTLSLLYQRVEKPREVPV